MCLFRANSSLTAMSAALRGGGGHQDFDPRTLISDEALNACSLPSVEGVRDLQKLFESLREQSEKQS